MSTLLNRKQHDLLYYRQQLKRSKKSNKSKQDLQLLPKLNSLQKHSFNRNLQTCWVKNQKLQRWKHKKSNENQSSLKSSQSLSPVNKSLMMGGSNVKFVEDFSMMIELINMKMLVKKFTRRKGLSLIVESKESLTQVNNFRKQVNNQNRNL